MHDARALARARACARGCAEMHDSSTWRDFGMSNSSRSSSLIDPSHMIRIKTGFKVEHPIQILIIWGRNKSMSFIELVDSIESSLGFPVQRFHELCSTRVTRVYELARGRVDSRGCAGRADVQGFSRWLAQGLFLGSRSFLDSVGGSSKVAYGRNLKRPLFGYASRRSLGVFLSS